MEIPTVCQSVGCTVVLLATNLWNWLQKMAAAWGCKVRSAVDLMINLGSSRNSHHALWVCHFTSLVSSFLICQLKEIGWSQWLVPVLSYKVSLLDQTQVCDSRMVVVGEGGDATSLILSTSFEASLLESQTNCLHSLSLNFFICEMKGLKPTFWLISNVNKKLSVK